MTRWERVRLIQASVRAPSRIGDVPALKSDLMGTRTRPEVEALLGDVRG